MTTFRLAATAASTTKADAVVIGLARTDGAPRLLAGSAELDAALGGGLLAALRAVGATGKSGEVTRIATLGRVGVAAVVAVGLGGATTTGATGATDATVADAAGVIGTETLRRAAGVAGRAVAGLRVVTTTLATDAAGDGADADVVARCVAALVEGLTLGSYDFVSYRHSSAADRTAAVGGVTVLTGLARAKPVTVALAEAQTVAAAVLAVRDLVNTPPGHLPPAELAAHAVAAAAGTAVTVTVHDEKALKRGGYGGLLGVGAGSSRPPRLVELRYTPAGARSHVALVGKGITFDSGGLSLKPPAAMEWMKTDMAGAASVLGTVLAAAQLKLPVTVTGWLACAENMPSGTAIRPGDVLTLRGGTTVEVLNTDAEGRLVLGDALVRACEDHPDLVLDVATLTGAQIVALGSRVSAVMANDDDLRARVVAAGERSGEAMWPMPLPEALRAGLDSGVADLQNIGDAKQGGGMLVAGIFLREFVAAGTRWAHLDIAGPSYNGGGAHGYTANGGTGTPVRTLLELLRDVAAHGA